MAPARSSCSARKPACVPGTSKRRAAELRREGNGHLAGNCLTVLQPIRNDSQRERFDCSKSLLAGAAVDGDSGQGWDIGNPAPVFFARELNFEVKHFGLRRLFDHFKVECSRLQELKRPPIIP